jgi:hypothetical protein
VFSGLIQNTILAANTSGVGDVYGDVGSGGNNLIGNTNGSGGWTASDLTGNSAAPLDPKLRPLANNGGLTFTLALLPGSPAIDQGSGGPTTDQRGRARPFDVSAVANTSGGDGRDIGAFEFTPPVLSIARAADKVLVSWPAYETDYTLEATTNLNLSINWSEVPGTSAIVAGQFTVTNSATVGNKFYRLRSR